MTAREIFVEGYSAGFAFNGSTTREQDWQDSAAKAEQDRTASSLSLLENPTEGMRVVLSTGQWWRYVEIEPVRIMQMTRHWRSERGEAVSFATMMPTLIALVKSGGATVIPASLPQEGN